MQNNLETFKFTLDEDEPKVEYEALITFFNQDTQRNYIVYTDNTTDEEGNLNTYASIYDPNSTTLELSPVETEDEWQNIEHVLDTFLGGEEYE